MGRTTTLQVRVVDVSSGGVANPASLLGASNGPQMGMMLAAKKYDHTLTKAMQFVIFP